MTSYTPSTYYNDLSGSITTNANVVRLTQYDTLDEIHFSQSSNLSRRFKFTISTNTWSDANTQNSNPGYLTDGLTSTIPSTFGGDVSGTPQPAIIGMLNTSGNFQGGFANPFYSSTVNTNSVSNVPSGSVTRSYNILTFTVNMSSPLSSSLYEYRITKDYYPVRTINHTSNSVDAVDTEPNPSAGLWQLWYDDGANLVLLGSRTVGSGGKVFSNFW